MCDCTVFRHCKTFIQVIPHYSQVFSGCQGLISDINDDVICRGHIFDVLRFEEITVTQQQKSRIIVHLSKRLPTELIEIMEVVKQHFSILSLK